MSNPGKLRKFVNIVGIAVAVVGLVGLAAAPVVRVTYKDRAVLTQRVQIDKAGASLFGDGTTPIGSPQLMIIDDPKAIVAQTGSEKQPRQVDDAYLKSHDIYPLQLKTVDFFVHWAQLGFIAATVVGALAAIGTRRKKVAA